MWPSSAQSSTPPLLHLPVAAAASRRSTSPSSVSPNASRDHSPSVGGNPPDPSATVVNRRQDPSPTVADARADPFPTVCDRRDPFSGVANRRGDSSPTVVDPRTDSSPTVVNPRRDPPPTIVNRRNLSPTVVNRHQQSRQLVAVSREPSPTVVDRRGDASASVGGSVRDRSPSVPSSPYLVVSAAELTEDRSADNHLQPAGVAWDSSASATDASCTGGEKQRAASLYARRRTVLKAIREKSLSIDVEKLDIQPLQRPPTSNEVIIPRN